MNTKSMCWSLFAGLLMLATAPSFAAAGKYTIRFGRSYKVNQKFRVTSFGQFQRSTVSMMGPRVLRQNKRAVTYRYSAELLILKVTAQGQPISETQKVIRYEKKIGKHWVAVLAPGTLIHGDVVNGKKIFSIKGQPVQRSKREMPSSVTRLDRVSGPSDDQIFGSSKARAIGESWSINNALAAKSLTKAKVTVQAKNLKGKTSFVGLSTIQGQRCVELRGKIDINALNVGLPPMFTHRKGRAEVSLTGHFPVDLTIPVLRLKRSMLMTFHASGHPQPGTPMVQVKLRMENNVSANFELLKN